MPYVRIKRKHLWSFSDCDFIYCKIIGVNISSIDSKIENALSLTANTDINSLERLYGNLKDIGINDKKIDIRAKDKYSKEIGEWLKKIAEFCDLIIFFDQKDYSESDVCNWKAELEKDFGFHTNLIE
jgi:hypothetical protein